MCLRTVDKKTVRRKYFYKVFEKENGWYRTPIMATAHRMGKTYVDESKHTITATDDRRYNSGYHGWLNLADARMRIWGNRVVVKCRISKITASGQNSLGFDGTASCIVAREMELICEVS